MIVATEFPSGKQTDDRDDPAQRRRAENGLAYLREIHNGHRKVRVAGIIRGTALRQLPFTRFERLGRLVPHGCKNLPLELEVTSGRAHPEGPRTLEVDIEDVFDAG